jgi:hypothetical protein
VDIKPANPLGAGTDDVEAGMGILLPVITILAEVLLACEGVFPGGIERQAGQQLLARTGKNFAEEGVVFLACRTKVDIRLHTRGGKTSCSAMQKFNVRYGCMLL